MKGLFQRFKAPEEIALVVLFPVMVVTIFVATMIRYLTTLSLVWAEELARYCMVWIGLLGASLGIQRNAHIGVEAFVSKLPDRFKPYLQVFRLGVVILFNFLIFIFSLQIIWSQIQTEQISPALRIPISFAYAAIPVGMLLMILRSIQGYMQNRTVPSSKN
ncbi:MAG: TRAP transporter small permease [Spirochaetales bacterium]